MTDSDETHLGFEPPEYPPYDDESHFFYDNPDRGAPQRVVIKLFEGVTRRYADRLERRELAEEWAAVKETWPEYDLAIRRLFRELTVREDVLPPLLTFYEVLLPPERELALAIGDTVVNTLSESDKVELVYMDSPPAPPPLGPCLGTSRPYLDAAPDGMAISAFALPPGGRWPRIVHLEKVWQQTHPDLRPVLPIPGFGGPGFAAYPGNFPADAAHATAVLGILAARPLPGGPDCGGMVPSAEIFFASSLINEPTGWVEAYASQIRAITDPLNRFMKPGDILLLELQKYARLYNECAVDVVPVGAQNILGPVELSPCIYWAIRQAVAWGIIVIEPASNGGVDMDNLVTWNKCLSYADWGAPSGAIVVAACKRPQPGGHGVLDNSNHGARTTCYAWGEWIITLDDANPTLIRTFDSTSGASALVAGVAALIQYVATSNTIVRTSPGAAGTRLAHPLTPQEMASALASSQTPPAARPAAGQNIGVMPNLRAIVDHFLPAV